MKITISLHTTLQLQTQNGIMSQLVAELSPRCTLAQLLAKLDIELDVENTLLVVNGRNADLNQVLSDGDQVHLIPAISGG